MPLAAHSRIASGNVKRPGLHIAAGQGAFTWNEREWGGWGSNPRPADYEKYGPMHRTHYLHGYREAVPLMTLIALLAPMARSTNRSTARRGPPPAPLLYVTSPGAPVPQPRERIAILCLGARHGLFWCWT